MNKVTIKEIREALVRQNGNTSQAGVSGEDLTRALLNQQKLSWYSIEQNIDTKSSRLTEINAKRVDFVVSFKGSSILLDSKCHTSLRDRDGSVTYKLKIDEINQLKDTGNEFGLDVFVIFWNRNGSERGQRYAICDVNEIKDSVAGDSTMLSVTFKGSDIYSVNLV